MDPVSCVRSFIGWFILCYAFLSSQAWPSVPLIGIFFLRNQVNEIIKRPPMVVLPCVRLKAVDKAFHSTNALKLSARPCDVDRCTSGRWKLGHFPRVQGPARLSRSPVDAPRPSPIATRPLGPPESPRIFPVPARFPRARPPEHEFCRKVQLLHFSFRATKRRGVHTASI
jgi:hypothetical protein